MEQLPIYVYIVFAINTLATVFFLYKASHYTNVLVIAILSWLAIQAAVSLCGFYKVTNVMPPRFMLLVVPPLLIITVLFLTKRGKAFIDSFDVKTLTLLHIVRVPVEITLYWLFLHKAVPKMITFEGVNFDVLSGLTAPVMYYFGYVRKTLGRNALIAWNIACLLLLFNVVTRAVLSAPFPIQQFSFDQPNIALLYFPFVWLPACVVPIVLFAHLASLKQLFSK